MTKGGREERPWERGWAWSVAHEIITLYGE